MLLKCFRPILRTLVTILARMGNSSHIILSRIFYIIPLYLPSFRQFFLHNPAGLHLVLFGNTFRMFHGVINGIILDELNRIREEIFELFEEMS